MVKILPPGTFELIKLRTGVWAYEDGTFLSIILKMGSRLAMLDIPDADGSDKPDGSMTRLTDAAETILNGIIPQRIDIAYSHAHFDHIGASTRFHRYMQKKYSSVPIFIWVLRRLGRSSKIHSVSELLFQMYTLGRRAETSL